MNCKEWFEKTNALLTVNSPVSHWRYQRLTAVALVPLTVWLLVLLNMALTAPYAKTVDWLSEPFNTLAILAWAIGVIYHAALGVQVVIEDYVSTISLRHRAIFATNLIFMLLAGSVLLSIIIILLIR